MQNTDYKSIEQIKALVKISRKLDSSGIQNIVKWNKKAN